MTRLEINASPKSRDSLIALSLPLGYNQERKENSIELTNKIKERNLIEWLRKFTYFFSLLPAPVSLNPLANGLLSILSWVICNRKGRGSNELRAVHPSAVPPKPSSTTDNDATDPNRRYDSIDAVCYAT